MKIKEQTRKLAAGCSKNTVLRFQIELTKSAQNTVLRLWIELTKSAQNTVLRLWIELMKSAQNTVLRLQIELTKSAQNIVLRLQIELTKSVTIPTAKATLTRFEEFFEEYKGVPRWTSLHQCLWSWRQGPSCDCRLLEAKNNRWKITVLSLTESLWLLKTSRESCKVGFIWNERRNIILKGVPFIAQPVTGGIWDRNER